MLRILVADGTPAAMQAERETFGIPSNASLFEAALSGGSLFFFQLGALRPLWADQRAILSSLFA